LADPAQAALGESDGNAYYFIDLPGSIRPEFCVTSVEDVAGETALSDGFAEQATVLVDDLLLGHTVAADTGKFPSSDDIAAASHARGL
jgi:hypothetical protein